MTTSLNGDEERRELLYWQKTHHAVSERMAITLSLTCSSIISSYVTMVMYSWSAVVFRTCRGKSHGK